jgi:hypothetical protein
MAALKEQELQALLKKVEKGQPLAKADVGRLKVLLDAMGTTIRVQSDQVRHLEITVAILRDATAAATAASSAAVNALRAVAPPAASIDAQAVSQEIQKLRADIEASRTLSETVAKAARFAVSLVGKFL